jgi:TfoX/Sxy family transcriptional regulator of competence genes
MKWVKSPEELIRLFEEGVTPFPQAERRKMFGYPCIFTNGNLTAGLFQDRLMLRLSEKDRADLLKVPGARVFEPMPGREMKEYVEVPKSVMSNPKGLDDWLRKSVSYVESLKPKVKKKKGKKP